VDLLSLNPLFPGIVAANFFLSGFLLAGTRADFKESERLVIDVAASLESIADECSILHRRESARKIRGCLESTFSLAEQIRVWFCRTGASNVLKSVSDLNHEFSSSAHRISATSISRLKADQATIRRAILRIESIRDTSFVSVGFIIAETASVALIGGLLFANIRPFYEVLFFVTALGSLLAFTVLLIFDLDDPFEYDSRGNPRGIADVSLKPIFEVQDRIRQRIESLPRRVESAGRDALNTKDRKGSEADDLVSLQDGISDEADIGKSLDEP